MCSYRQGYTDCPLERTLPVRESRVKESKSSTPESPKKGQAKMMNSPRGKGKKIDLEDCVTEYDIMDGDGCLIGPDFKTCSLAPSPLFEPIKTRKRFVISP